MYSNIRTAYPSKNHVTTHPVLLLSKKTLIIFVKTKPERGKWGKHDIRWSIAPFSHLLSFACGLYMTTATLLNGHLYTECYKILLNLCTSVPVFHIALSRNVCSKMLSALSTPAYIHLHYMLVWAFETKHLSLKSNLNLIPKCHKLTHISFFPYFIDCCIYSPTLQAIFDHMKPNIDP